MSTLGVDSSATQLGKAELMTPSKAEPVIEAEVENKENMGGMDGIEMDGAFKVLPLLVLI